MNKVDPITGKSYLAGLAVILAAAYSQYFVRFSPALGMIVVYGLPLFVTGRISGRSIMSRAFENNSAALKYGLGFFGICTVLGNIAGTIIFFFLQDLDPAAINLLHRANPVLHIHPRFAWIMIWLSLLLIGPAEEYLFRGFVFGGLLRVLKGRHWLSLAFFSSALFAFAHLYYALVFGVASLIQFADILAFGLAMSITYYLSGGNLLIPALIHGVYDASGFMTIISPATGILIRGLLTTTGILAGIGLLVNRRKRTAL